MFNLGKLIQMQRELDNRIQSTKAMPIQELIEKKSLALLVELGELANETRCFKFWSQKGPSARELILDEFADGLHFILSLGITLGMDEDDTPIMFEKGIETNCTTCFIQMYQSALAFCQETNAEGYSQLLNQYLQLGFLLGFSFEDIEQAYVKKNLVNHDRQRTGY